MATFLDLQTRVQRRLIDLPAAVLAEVPTLVNEAIRTLETKHNFKAMETLGGPYVTTAFTRVLTAVPSDFKEYNGKPYFREDLGRIRKLFHGHSRLAEGYAFSDNADTDFGEPVSLLESEADASGGRNWEIWPFPDGNSDHSDGEYRIYVPYYRFLPDLSADGDTNWFTLNAVEYIIFKATAEGFALDWDEDRMLVWETKAAAKQKEAINLDKYHALSKLETLVPHLDVHDQEIVE